MQQSCVYLMFGIPNNKAQSLARFYYIVFCYFILFCFHLSYSPLCLLSHDVNLRFLYRQQQQKCFSSFHLHDYSQALLLFSSMRIYVRMLLRNSKETKTTKLITYSIRTIPPWQKKNSLAKERKRKNNNAYLSPDKTNLMYAMCMVGKSEKNSAAFVLL